jgi:hypothetical protein
MTREGENPVWKKTGKRLKNDALIRGPSNAIQRWWDGLNEQLSSQPKTPGLAETVIDGIRNMPVKIGPYEFNQ